MIRLVRSELFKIRTTRLYFGLLVAATGLVVVVTGVQLAFAGEASLTIEGASSAVETEEDLRSILNAGGIASLFTLVLGATAVASEYRHRTIAGTYLITPARWRVVLAKIATYFLAGLIFGMVVEAGSLAVVSGWLAISGEAIPFGAQVAQTLALTPVLTGLSAAFGVGIGAAVPNQLGAVLVSLGWVMVLEQLLSGLFPAIAPWLPFAGVNAALTGQNPEFGAAIAIVLSLAYLAAVSAVGIQVVRTRDVA